MSSNELRLVKSKELSKIISIPESTIREYSRRGIIPAYKITKEWLYDPVEVIHSIKKVIDLVQ